VVGSVLVERRLGLRWGRLGGSVAKLLVDVAVSQRTSPCWASYIDPQQWATVKGR